MNEHLEMSMQMISDRAIGQQLKYHMRRAGAFLGNYLLSLRDTTQIGVHCADIFTPDKWSGSRCLPTVSGSTRLYQSFRPTDAIVTEDIAVTYEKEIAETIPGASLTTKGQKRKRPLPPRTLRQTVRCRRAVSLPRADDAVLIQAYSGSINCFPNAPNLDNGISGAAFAFDAPMEISWPTLGTGVDMNVSWALKESVLYRIPPPDGFTENHIASVEVAIHLNLFGRVTR